MRQIPLIMIGLSISLYADFTRDDATQIVTDNSTGLQWQDDSDAKTVTKKWTEAIAYCEGLTLGGHDDWRLPNSNELYYIADRSKRNPAIDSTFQNVYFGDYWSSTTVVGNEDDAWGFNFQDFGYDYLDDKSRFYYVRCVRASD